VGTWNLGGGALRLRSHSCFSPLHFLQVVREAKLLFSHCPQIQSPARTCPPFRVWSTNLRGSEQLLQYSRELRPPQPPMIQQTLGGAGSKETRIAVPHP
jgi:hypothetical protein